MGSLPKPRSVTAMINLYQLKSLRWIVGLLGAVVVGAWFVDDRFLSAGEFQQYIKGQDKKFERYYQQTDKRIQSLERHNEQERRWKLVERIERLERKQSLTIDEREWLRTLKAELRKIEGRR